MRAAVPTLLILAALLWAPAVPAATATATATAGPDAPDRVPLEAFHLGPGAAQPDVPDVAAPAPHLQPPPIDTMHTDLDTDLDTDDLVRPDDGAHEPTTLDPEAPASSNDKPQPPTTKSQLRTLLQGAIDTLRSLGGLLGAAQ